MKGNFDIALATGWHAVSFDRTKNVKPLGEYLKPALTPEQQRELDAQRVRQAFERRIKKQRKEAGDGPR
jgi:hypothetical protein